MMEYISTNSFIAGVMVGILLASVWFFRDSSPFERVAAPAPAATGTIATEQESNSVSVSNQPSGDTVVVESVTVPPPGVWVAVREVIAGDLGNVLGAARVSGPKSNVQISLLRATEPGHSYAVQLYRDDDNGIFDVTVNSAYIDFTTGTKAIAYFATTP